VAPSAIIATIFIILATPSITLTHLNFLLKGIDFIRNSSHLMQLLHGLVDRERMHHLGGLLDEHHHGAVQARVSDLVVIVTLVFVVQQRTQLHLPVAAHLDPVVVAVLGVAAVVARVAGQRVVHAQRRPDATRVLGLFVGLPVVVVVARVPDHVQFDGLRVLEPLDGRLVGYALDEEGVAGSDVRVAEIEGRVQVLDFGGGLGVGEVRAVVLEGFFLIGSGIFLIWCNFF
jgi:hypothetical protein